MIQGKNTKLLPFVYAVDITLAASALGSISLTLSADSTFELVSFDASTNNAAAQTDMNPDYFTVQITDQGTGRALSSTKLHQRILCGNAYRGRYQRNAVMFSPLTTILFEFQNLVAAELQVQLGLVGFKHFVGAGSPVG